MNILIAGGAGFIGSHLTDKCIEKGHHVSVIDNLSNGKIENENPHASTSHFNVRLRYDLDITFQRSLPEIVVYLITEPGGVKKSLEDPQRCINNNVNNLINVLECMVKYKTKKIIFSSSGAVYQPPVEKMVETEHPIQPANPYGLSKRISEQIIQMYANLYNFNYAILRYSNVYGPRRKKNSGFINLLRQAAKRKKTFTVYGDGSQTRDFISVHDIVEATYNAISLDKFNLISNVCTGKKTTLKSLIELFPKLKVKYEKPNLGEIQNSVLFERTMQTHLWTAQRDIKEEILKDW